MVPRFFRFAGDFERRGRFAPLVPLLEDLAILPDFQFEPFRERVDDRDADPVQAAGDFIPPCSNLPPACRTVSATSAADFFCVECMPVGMPRPLSTTVTLPSM